MIRKQMVGANPTVGARKNHSQDGDPQATGNPLELPFAISRGEGTRPLRSHWCGLEQSPIELNTTLQLQAV